MIRPRDPNDPRFENETSLQSQRHPVRLPSSTAQIPLVLGFMITVLGDGAVRWVGIGLLALGGLLYLRQFLVARDSA